MMGLLAGLDCKAWNGDILWWGESEDDLVRTMDAVSGRIVDFDLFAAAHKDMFHDTQITLFGKVFSGGQFFSVKRLPMIEIN